jgi:hypothetical protein
MFQVSGHITSYPHQIYPKEIFNEDIFNKKTGIWGHEHPAAEDFAEVPMTMSTNSESVEAFTIELSAASETNGTLKAMWGTAVLSANFTASADVI